jgi:pimeloyl-ACP methyl ester carboxylesterase
MNINTSDVNPAWPGIADIYQGIITLPYYLDAPTDENPAAQLATRWQAAPGAYVPPFDEFGLDPTSTHITIANPIPVKKGDQTVPIIVTVPNASSGQTKPASGWPVVIFGHGIAKNRIDALGVADTLASQGYAVVAIDHPLHGVSPDAEPSQAPFWIENTQFAAIANERTFDSDFLNNVTLQFGPDELIDPSGVISIPAAIGNLLGGRDNLRQGAIDLSVVALSISSMDINLDAQPDLDASNMAYAGLSWGAMYGTLFVAIEPLITRAVLLSPGGGIARFAVESQEYGAQVNAILAQAGLEPGTADYEGFLLLWQTALDASDPINWSVDASTKTPIMLHEVINDLYIPNYVLTAPLSGTEPMIRIMGLDAYSTSQVGPDGLRSAARFVPPAEHAQILSPTYGSPAAYLEKQKQMASFIDSHGGAIEVSDESTMLPVMEMEGQSAQAVTPLTEKKKGSKADNSKKPFKPISRLETQRRSAGDFEQLDRIK